LKATTSRPWSTVSAIEPASVSARTAAKSSNDPASPRSSGSAPEPAPQASPGRLLSITKAILDRLGGRIGFDSDAGAGTTFYFDLAEYHEAGAGADSEASWDDGR
jgi:hypothetical protein